MNLTFFIFELLIEEKLPSIKDLKSAFVTSLKEEYDKNDTYYLIDKEILHDRYLWLYARHGKPTPHTDEVYNISDHEEENNPRKPDQIEMTKQIFFLYDIEKHKLYLSSLKNKTLVEEYLAIKIGKKVNIRNFYKSFKEFSKEIKTIEKVGFIGKRSLYNQKLDFWKIFSRKPDPIGFGEPEEFKLELKFGKSNVVEAAFDYINRMIKYRDDINADSISLAGINDINSNFEAKFNIKEFVQKFDVKVDKDKQELYVPKSSQNKLIKKIGG